MKEKPWTILETGCTHTLRLVLLFVTGFCYFTPISSFCLTLASRCRGVCGTSKVMYTLCLLAASLRLVGKKLSIVILEVMKRLYDMDLRDLESHPLYF